jgi:hypothetical protein
MACKLNSLENSNIEQLWAFNQQLSKILMEGGYFMSIERRALKA